MEEDQVGGATSAIYYYDIDTDQELNLDELHEYSTTIVYSLANTSTEQYISFGDISAVIENDKYVINYNYAPLANYNGVEDFEFNASDGVNVLDPIAFTVTVNPVNDPPVIDPIGDQYVDEDEGIDMDEEGNFTYQLTATDIDNDPDLNNPPTDQISEFVFSYVLSGVGSCDIDQDTDIITVTPSDNFNGPFISTDGYQFHGNGI